jgi:hypothetical protein
MFKKTIERELLVYFMYIQLFSKSLSLKKFLVPYNINHYSSNNELLSRGIIYF